jgi:hypothetical protein
MLFETVPFCFNIKSSIAGCFAIVPKNNALVAQFSVQPKKQQKQSAYIIPCPFSFSKGCKWKISVSATGMDGVPISGDFSCFSKA